MVKREVISGIYILDFDTCIKIGRSKDILSRVKQYNGYRSEENVKKLLFVFTREHKYIEKQSHQFAQKYLPRMSKFEKFICIKEEDKQSFIEKYKDFLQTNHIEIIEEIVDKFEEEQKINIIGPINNSNLYQRKKSKVQPEFTMVMKVYEPNTINKENYNFDQFAFKYTTKK